MGNFLRERKIIRITAFKLDHLYIYFFHFLHVWLSQMIDIGSIQNVVLNFSLNRIKLWRFQILKILILRIILRKLQNSKQNSKNKTILRIRILVNTSPCISVYSIWYLKGYYFTTNVTKTWERNEMHMDEQLTYGFTI